MYFRKLTGNKISGSRAFTIIEFLVTMTIAFMVIGGISLLLVQSNKTAVTQTYIVGMQQSARVALDLMTEEILKAGYDPTNPDYLVPRIAPVVEINPTTTDPFSTQIRVLADLNQDGDTLDTDENIFYQWDAATLEITRDDGGGPKVISTNVTDLAITFDPAATTVGSGAASSAATLGVKSTAGFNVGDWIYISDGLHLDNTFVTGIAGGTTLAIHPPLGNSFGSGSTVAHVSKVRITLTVQTSNKDPQTGQYKTIDLVSDVTLRNFTS